MKSCGAFQKTEHLCLWALCFLMCGRFMWCPVLSFTLGDTSGALTSRSPLFWPPQTGRHLLQNTLLLRRYATTNTYFNNYSNQQWSWVSNKDLEISIRDYDRRKCEHQCWVGIWFVNKHQFTFIKYFRTSVWYFCIHWRRMLQLQTNSLGGGGSALIQPFKGKKNIKTTKFGTFSVFY